MDFKACGRSLLWNWLVKLILTKNLIKIASKLTSIVTILENIALAGGHIFQVLAQYLWVLPQYLRVLSQYLWVLSRWIHPYTVVTLWYPFGGKGLSMRFDKWRLTALQMGSKLDGVGPLKQFFIGPTIFWNVKGNLHLAWGSGPCSPVVHSLSYWAPQPVQWTSVLVPSIFRDIS